MPSGHPGRRPLLAITLVLPLLGGCAAVGPVALRHADTGQAVRCPGYWYWNIDTLKGQIEEAKQQSCVEAYERQGYVRLDR